MLAGTAPVSQLLVRTRTSQGGKPAPWLALPAHKQFMAPELTTTTPSGKQVHVSYSRDDIRIQGPNVDLEAFPQYLQKDCLLFHYPETETLARKICDASGSKVELGEIKWACVPKHSMTEHAQPLAVLFCPLLDSASALCFYLGFLL